MTPTASFDNNEARDMNEGTHKYWMPANEEERARLEKQHQFLKLIRKDPLPQGLKLTSSSKILDSGTGSGAWALEAAAAVPSGAIVYAVDVESRLFPTQQPANTIFSVHSVLSLPAEWSSTFDFIHQRLLVGALGKADWSRALSELLRVLKPGGILMLEESSGGALLPDGVDVSQTAPNTTRMDGLLQRLYGARDTLLTCGKELPAMIKWAGFQVVSQEIKVLPLGPGDIGTEARWAYIAAYRQFGQPLAAYGLVQSMDEWEPFLDRLQEEWEASDLPSEFYIFTARKPKEAL